MGKIDIEAKDYFSDSKRFADIFNFWIYEGRTVIQPHGLKEIDSQEIALPHGNNVKSPIQKFRDLLNIYASMEYDRAIYLILGLEFESKIHYAMPVRTMLYDAMNYSEQIQKISKIHRNKKSTQKMNNSEYLSGFLKNDRLIPVITLTVNISGSKWDGATNIHEMLDINDKFLLGFIPNYHINLLSPDQIDDKDFDKFTTGIGSLLQFIKHKNDKNMDWIKVKKNALNM